MFFHRSVRPLAKFEREHANKKLLGQLTQIYDRSIVDISPAFHGIIDGVKRKKQKKHRKMILHARYMSGGNTVINGEEEKSNPRACEIEEENKKMLDRLTGVKPSIC